MTGESIDHTPRSGTAGECSPARAQRWLEHWRAIGGGITITVDRRINPWRFIPAGLDPHIRHRADDMQTTMLRQLDQQPGLADAIRTVVSADAFGAMRRALNAMGRNQE